MEQNNIRSRSVCQRDECSKTHLPLINSKNIISPKNNFTKTFFLPEKDKGDFYFRNTKVGSCRKIIVKNSLPLAMTFKIRNQKGEPLTKYNHLFKQIPKTTSSYFYDYCTPKTENHAGMMKKPLVPYNPDHTRNLLMDDFTNFCDEENKNNKYIAKLIRQYQNFIKTQIENFLNTNSTFPIEEIKKCKNLYLNNQCSIIQDYPIWLVESDGVIFSFTPQILGGCPNLQNFAQFMYSLCKALGEHIYICPFNKDCILSCKCSNCSSDARKLPKNTQCAYRAALTYLGF